MKKILLSTLLFIAASAQLSAQDYIPLIDNTVWTVQMSGFSGSQNLFYGPGTDETIGAYTYRKVSNVPMTSGDVYLREDIAEKKVYRLVDNQDELLYDFSLEENDEITLNGNIYTVTSKSLVSVMTGPQRVRIHLVRFVGGMATSSETWIEGVGSQEVPLKPSYELFSDPAFSLVCSTTNNDPVYNRGLVNTGTPTECPQAQLGTEEFAFENMQLSPNPFSSQTTITTSGNFNNAELIVYNSLGQTVRRTNNIYGREYILDRGQLTSGVYFIKILDSGKEILSKNIIVID